MKINNQPVEKVELDPNGSLDVYNIWRTIQGEGPLTGMPAVFIRLAGCTLKCNQCFHSNTIIRMADFSTKLISEVKEGDLVLSYDEHKEEFVSKKVTTVMSRFTDEIFNLDTGGKRTYVTGEHPFLVKKKGWIHTKDLKPGDKILHLSLSELRRLHNPMKDSSVVEKVKRTRKRRKKEIEGYGMMSKEAKERVREMNSKRMKENNPMKDPSVAVKGFLNRKDRGKMSRTEKFVFRICNGMGLEFVGDGSLVVGNKIPDFLVTGTKKLIEVWDQEQTKYLKRGKKWKLNRRRVFESSGYEVLFLPVTVFPLDGNVGSRKPKRLERRENEVRRIKKEVANYVRNGATVKSVSLVNRHVNQKSWTRLAGTKEDPLRVYNLEVEDTHTYVADGMIVHNCDTDYTSKRKMMEVKDIVNQVKSRLTKGLVVLTGGEPFRQNISPLTMALLKENYLVQVETNGTVHPWGVPWRDERFSVVCSPKTPKIDKEVLTQPRVDWKYVVRSGWTDPDDGLPTITLGSARPARPDWSFGPRVWVQPQDEQSEEANKANIDAALKSCFRFGYRLSLQTHKMIGLE